MSRPVQDDLYGGEKVPDSAKWESHLPVEASIPDSTVSLESILCTEELRRRPSRLPDYEKENRALVALLGALLDSHPNILQTLADTILDVIQFDSSGAADETLRCPERSAHRRGMTRPTTWKSQPYDSIAINNVHEYSSCRFRQIIDCKQNCSAATSASFRCNVTFRRG
jgi:hypothetical protein